MNNKFLINFGNSQHVDKLINHLQSLDNDVYEVTIKKYKRKRSIEQNSYYWGCIVNPLAEHFGYLPDEMHEELKLKFNKKTTESKLEPGKTIVYGGSTTELNTAEMTHYLESIRIWANTEFGFEIPSPDEYSNELKA